MGNQVLVPGICNPFPTIALLLQVLRRAGSPGRCERQDQIEEAEEDYQEPKSAGYTKGQVAGQERNTNLFAIISEILQYWFKVPPLFCREFHCFQSYPLFHRKSPTIRICYHMHRECTEKIATAEEKLIGNTTGVLKLSNSKGGPITD